MKISVITVVYNGERTIADTLASVAAQTHKDVEHVVVDGASQDGTLATVRRYPHVAACLSERDHGVYDAMNKGIRRATGEVIGTLNADDVYQHDGVLEHVACAFDDPGVDVCYGDLVYVSPRRPDQIIRYWKAGPFDRKRLRSGWYPPHPTFFVRRSVYDRWGAFDPAYPLAGDVELMFRILGKGSTTVVYLPEVLVRMRLGGISNARISTVWNQNVIIRRAARLNGIELVNPLLYFVRKLLSRGSQYLDRGTDR
jgi:glycosyltransferase involved in cell wall biosynthesis